MEELKEKLIGLGIAEEQIEGVIDTVLGFLRDKLPAGMQGIVDSIKNGETPGLDDLGDLGGIGDAIGGIFGKKD